MDVDYKGRLDFIHASTTHPKIVAFTGTKEVKHIAKDIAKATKDRAADLYVSVPPNKGHTFSRPSRKEMCHLPTIAS